MTHLKNKLKLSSQTSNINLKRNSISIYAHIFCMYAEVRKPLKCRAHSLPNELVHLVALVL